MHPGVPTGTVTFLFTDIEGSTRLLETLREQYESLLAEHNRIFQEALSHWNGHAIETRGDSFFIAFPRAMDAVQYASEIQRTLYEYVGPAGTKIKVRMGLHTGEPLVSQSLPITGYALPGGDATIHPSYIGMDVHRAARIAAAGHGGQILLSQTTRDLIYQDLPDGISLKNLGMHSLKDIRYPQPIFQLIITGLPAEFPPLNTMAPQADSFPSIDSATGEYHPIGAKDEVEPYNTLIHRWRAQGKEVLDRGNLAILQAAPPEVTYQLDDLVWLMRSLLQNNLPLEDWLNRATDSQEAVAALEQLLQEYPRPTVRLEIVQTLCTIPDEQVILILLDVISTDDNDEVLSRAAVEASRRGMLNEVFSTLIDRTLGRQNPAAIAALIVIVDEFGNPPTQRTDYPGFQVMVGLIQLRWQRGRAAVGQRSIRSLVGGTLALAILGCFIPLLALWIYPEDFEQNRRFVSIAAWVLSGAFVGGFWGGIQGFFSGLITGLVDVLWSGKSSAARRFFIAGIAGLVFSLLFILFALSGLLKPTAGPQIYVPVFLVYGYLQGCGLSWVIPRLGERFQRSVLLRKYLKTTLYIGAIAPLFVYLVYHDQTLARLPIDWLYAVLMPAGLSLVNNR
jgi:class 3 adenylate cyclase